MKPIIMYYFIILLLFVFIFSFKILRRKGALRVFLYMRPIMYAVAKEKPIFKCVKFRLVLAGILLLVSCAPRAISLPASHVKNSPQFCKINDTVYESRNFVYHKKGHAFIPVRKK